MPKYNTKAALDKGLLPGWIKVENGRILLNTAHAEQFFGVHRSTLKTWADRGCPKEKRGWWDIKAVMKWRGILESDKKK